MDRLAGVAAHGGAQEAVAGGLSAHQLGAVEHITVGVEENCGSHASA
jgi:hypothetical protein